MWELPHRDKVGGTPDQGIELLLIEQRLNFIVKGGVRHQNLAEVTQVVQQFLGDGLTSKIPDHRTQLIVGVEANAMVDQPEMMVVVEQQVTTLAVGVVDQQIE